MQGLRSSDNVGRRSRDERRMSNDDSRRRNWRGAEIIHRPGDRRNPNRANYESGPQWSQRDRGFENGNRANTHRFNANTRGYQSGNFSRGDQRNRGSSENFSRGARRPGG
ncbi:hypothetical protein TNCV_2624731 [Trichonephila clavipes]|nr:hypothetical protein TNCV_2624731 [Trichonephila clavipes]